MNESINTPFKIKNIVITMDKKTPKILEISGNQLSIENVVYVGHARPNEVEIRLSVKAKEAIQYARQIVDDAVKRGLTIYGINTGFGSQAEKVINSKDVALLQRYLIMSHSAGVGEPFSPEIIRAAMLIRANTLAKGNSGVRIEIIQTLLHMLNKGVVPKIPRKGSLGASGDLAPLSHIALVFSRDPREEHIAIENKLKSKILAGKPLNSEERVLALKESGEAYLWSEKDEEWESVSGIEAMARAGIDRVILDAKEGLALNNGSTVSAAMSTFAVHFGHLLQMSADIIAALTIESVKGFESAFYDGLQKIRPHRGQMESASRIVEYLRNSTLVKHVDQIQNSTNVYRDFNKVQDSYSIRCIPQVHGPVIDTLYTVRDMINTEINSATDNPLIITNNGYLNKSFSGGNFHGQYISLYLDNLGTAFGILGNISERRIFKLVTGHLSEGLPSFLINPPLGKEGLMNGAMILQYTAAHLVSENKVLSHPASSDSIPSCEDKEDFVSMAPIAASKALTILNNSEYILAIELWCDIIALRLRAKEGLVLSDNAKKVLKFFNSKIEEFTEDRVVYDEVRELQKFIHNGELLSLLNIGLNF